MCCVAVVTAFITVLRKDHLRGIKLLQRTEMKEATNFFTKITGERDSQDKKFETERQVSTFYSCVFSNSCLSLLQELEARYRTELDGIKKKMMKELEKMESQHYQNYKSKTKQLKSEQVGVNDVTGFYLFFVHRARS